MLLGTTISYAVFVFVLGAVQCSAVHRLGLIRKEKMRREFVDYVEFIVPPFFLIWVFVFSLPQAAFPFRLAAQIFSFIFVRDAMIPTKMWTITDDFSLTFIDDAMSLFLVSLSSVFMAGLVYHTNKENASIVLFRQNPSSCLQAGVLASLIIYVPVYFLKNKMGSATKTIPYDALLLAGNLALTLCGNLVEELLFRSCLASYLKKLGVTQMRSALLQAAAFAIYHLYLAYFQTNCKELLLLFTFWEGLVCALLHQRCGLGAATVAHALAIFYITINLFR